MGKLVVVTSRQPDPAAAASKGNAGGVVAALAPALERCRGTWIGGEPVFPGDLSNGADQGTAVEPPYQHATVRYDGELHEGFYAGLSNGVLWPLYHSMSPDHSRCRPADWRDYWLVNRQFAQTAAEQSEPGSFVWVHDYQLSLVPELLRERVDPRVRIGFFLHTPFPGYDVFRILPWSREILRGMLGADLIGFHTEHYRHNFCECVERLLDVPCSPDADEVQLGDRTVQLRNMPVGIDAEAISRLAADAEVVAMAEDMRASIGGERLMLGVDRLDYTKGIDRRVEAMESLLEYHPEWRGRVVLTQIAVPSRAEVESYQVLRRELEQLVGAVNGRWADETWSPIKLLCRSYPLPELVAWYRAADVALVTPLRDGMNLVAKEYCAANRDSHAVLVLSELAGAAAELTDALLVNPYDLDGMRRIIHQALELPEAEARERMARMNRRIEAWDANRWVESFLAEADWRH